jgi:hypothetical protein
MTDELSEAQPAAPAEPGRPWRPTWRRRDVRLVPIEPLAVAVPGFCACCGVPAASSRVETRPKDGKTLIVSYCDGCLRHASRTTTRSLSAALAGLMIGVSLSLALPLVWENAPLGALVVVVVMAALVPPLLALLLATRPQPGHSASGRAAWWTAAGELACTSPRWAAALAMSAGVRARPGRLREGTPSAWTLAGPIIALIGAPIVHRFHHPLVRVVNLTEDRIEIYVDGRRMGSIEPTSAESPAAGTELRVPSGRRTFNAVASNGQHLARTTVSVRSGARHFYAPASNGHCFWLERTRYGRNAAGALERHPLGGAQAFWVLPGDLDTWFAPNPEPGELDRRSSGGELLALRQARCSEAPANARGGGQ